MRVSECGLLVLLDFKNCLDSKWKGRLKSWALFSPTGAPGCCTVAVPLTRGLVLSDHSDRRAAEGK